MRTEDALGYFSAQMLGQIALPHVARAAVAAKSNRDPVDGTDSSPAQAAADTKRDPAPHPEPHGLIDRVKRIVNRKMKPPPPESSFIDAEEQAENDFSQRLGVCGCGAPLEAMRALRQVLGRRHLHEHVEASSLPAEGLYMLVLYLLDEKELVEHGSSLHGCWLTPKGLELLAWLDEQDELLADAPEPTTKTCGTCTRVVPLGDWSYLFDSCSECAENASRTGDNWRDFVREQDRLRLIGEFAD